jgi:hypothetical protein
VRRVGFIVGATLVGCATAATPVVPSVTRRAAVASSAPISRPPDVELFFDGEQPMARRGQETWALGDVTRGEMIFSPDKRRFAYVRVKERGPTRILVRNLAGDPLNDFATYRPGAPKEMLWIDNRRIGYLSIDESKKPTHIYVVHDAETGEVLAARTGVDAIWSPSKRHLALVTGSGDQQALVVDGRNVWPRRGLTKIIRGPVWSADGRGLALVEDGRFGPRLVVMVEFTDAHGDLTWVIPREAMAPGLNVFWAGDNKVVIGESALKPKFAADWERLQ